VSGDQLPAGWAATTLERVLAEDLCNGRSVPTAEFGFPVLRLTALVDGCIDLAQRKTGQWTREDAAKYFVRAGDFLISRGNGSIRLVGRGGIVPHDDEVAFPDTMIRARPAAEAMSPRFLRYQWEMAAVREQIENAAKTTAGIHKVSQGDLRRIRLRLAPLPEQHRIVAEIEKHFSRLDAAVTTLARVQVEIERARASVLKAAVEGRLVPTEAALARAEGRSYEPASALLERVLEERRRRHEEMHGGKKYKPAVEPETAGTPLPQGWVWATLDSLADVVGGITKNKDYVDGRDVPYLRVANVQRGILDLSVVKTILAPEEKIRKLRLQPGDILLNEGGDRDKLGRGWVWEGQIEECIHQNHVFRARVHGGLVDSKYVSHYANSLGQSYFLGSGKQTTNLASISLANMKRLPIPLPPREEQHRIVAEVSRRLSVLDTLAHTVARNLARCTALRQSILARAFSGKLVPQDPTDEPASALLERVRASAAAQRP
jgi:type I restriction enzyme, S subunit